MLRIANARYLCGALAPCACTYLVSRAGVSPDRFPKSDDVKCLPCPSSRAPHSSLTRCTSHILGCCRLNAVSLAHEPGKSSLRRCGRARSWSEHGDHRALPHPRAAEVMARRPNPIAHIVGRPNSTREECKLPQIAAELADGVWGLLIFGGSSPPVRGKVPWQTTQERGPPDTPQRHSSRTSSLAPSAQNPYALSRLPQSSSLSSHYPSSTLTKAHSQLLVDAPAVLYRYP